MPAPSPGSSPGRGMVAVPLQKREGRWAVRFEEQPADPFEGSALNREMLAPSFGVAKREIQRALFQIDRTSTHGVVEHSDHLACGLGDVDAA